MTEEEIKNKISEHKECCKKLAEEYRQRYNEDNTDKLALNMFYHNVISYNDFETILAIIEDRNSMIMCFSEPPYLTEETVEVNIMRIAELEKEVELWKKASENNSYKAFQLQEANNTLSKHIVELQKDKGELTDRCKELEAQIEKLKGCGNCKNEGDYKEPYRYGTGWCNICKRHKVAKGNFDKWEIKEK